DQSANSVWAQAGITMHLDDDPYIMEKIFEQQIKRKNLEDSENLENSEDLEESTFWISFEVH
ncbi:2135_t:CDS:2, partial [Gigaspora rosea]